MNNIRSKVQNWVKVSLLFLLIAAFLGLALRWFFVHPIPSLNYKFLLHAHSHVMLLGWGFNALFAGIVGVLYSNDGHIPPKLSILFWGLQCAVLGMLVTFPIMGYALWSIVFSSLHILLSFYFIFLVSTKAKSLSNQYQFTVKFLLWSVLFLLISSLGPFSLGIIMAKGLADGPWYHLSIYYYLHFQYNGWISFALFGLLFWMVESRGLLAGRIWSRYFYLFLTISCVPAFALSALWTHPPLWVYLVGAAAAMLQLIALVFLVLWLYNLRLVFKQILSKWTFTVLSLALTAFILKILLQCLSAIPMLADLAYTQRNYIIGYIHLVFLGFVTLFLIGWFSQFGVINPGRTSAKWGLWVFMVGFIGNEAYLMLPFLSSATSLGLYKGLVLFSLIMLLGLAMLIWPSTGEIGDATNTALQ